MVFLKVGMHGPLGRHDCRAGNGRRGRAPRLQQPGQQAARLGAARPGRRAQELADNTPAVVHYEIVRATTSK
jgi:hypothetical protein